jgi:hypothetical protein
MPLKRTKLLIIGCYPSFGTLERSPAREAEEKTLGEWRDSGSLDAYRTAYETFLRDFVNWNITRKYVSRVLEVAYPGVLRKCDSTIDGASRASGTIWRT